MDELTKEDVLAQIDAAHLAATDPDEFAKQQATASINAEFDARKARIDAVDAGPDALVKVTELRDLALAALEPVVPDPEPVVTVEHLDVPEKPKGTPVEFAKTAEGSSITKFVQKVEPERDGVPWCTWEDAEAMLVNSAKSQMRGRDLGHTGYRLTRDETALTLTLELMQ